MPDLECVRRALARATTGATSVLLLAAVAACSTPSELPDKGTAEKLYADAKDEMSSGAWSNAVTLLERVEGLASGTVLGQQAQLDHAYAQWKGGEPAKALATLDRFIKFNPSSPGMDYALYLRGLVNFNDNLGFLGSVSGQRLSERDQQASREAYQSFKQLVEQFPNSRYAADARQRMNYTVNALAEYEVLVARYYLRRGAYLAAASRAQHALQTYPQTPAIEQALAVMVRAYDKLEQPQLRDDAQRVLALNYPSSLYLGGELDADERPWWRLW